MVVWIQTIYLIYEIASRETQKSKISRNFMILKFFDKYVIIFTRAQLLIYTKDNEINVLQY